MRLLATLFTVVALAFASMFAHAGSAMAMEGMAGTVMMAEMNMGADDAPACPPAMCAKMKACAASSAPVAAVVPEATVTAFAPGVGLPHLALQVPDLNDAVSGQGLRRPPRFI